MAFDFYVDWTHVPRRLTTALIGSQPSDHYFHSVCLCRVFLSRLWSDFDQTWTYVICLGL